MERFLSFILSALHVHLLLVLPSENVNINGTRGAPLLWQCQHNFTEPFHTKQSNIYWQGQSNSDIVVHAYVKGEEDLKHQSPSFNNRTKFFPEEIPSGNLSLLIEPLMLRDDQTSLCVVVLGDKPAQNLCLVTLYVAAPFQKPRIEVNTTTMTATCSTKGGYPKPEIKWRTEVGTELEQQVQTDMSVDVEGTYNITSTANITGLTKVTCEVYNPTSNETRHVTEVIASSNGPALEFLWFLVLVPVIIGVVLLIYYCKTPGRNEHREQGYEMGQVRR